MEVQSEGGLRQGLVRSSAVSPMIQRLRVILRFFFLQLNTFFRPFYVHLFLNGYHRKFQVVQKA